MPFFPLFIMSIFFFFLLFVCFTHTHKKPDVQYMSLLIDRQCFTLLLFVWDLLLVFMYTCMCALWMFKVSFLVTSRLNPSLLLRQVSLYTAELVQYVSCHCWGDLVHTCSLFRSIHLRQSPADILLPAYLSSNGSLCMYLCCASFSEAIMSLLWGNWTRAEWRPAVYMKMASWNVCTDECELSSVLK